jgi:hypothetical protein
MLRYKVATLSMLRLSCLDVRGSCREPLVGGGGAVKAVVAGGLKSTYSKTKEW